MSDLKSLEKYYQEMTTAVLQNPPVVAFGHERVIEGWRYYMRGFGHGLQGFIGPECDKRIKDIKQTVYGSWFIKASLTGRKIPDIDAKKFIGWIDEGMTE